MDREDGTRVTGRPRKNRFKETSRRLRQGEKTGHRASLDWRHDAGRVCETGGHAERRADIAGLLETVAQCRTGKVLLDGCLAEGMKVVYDMQNPGAQYYPKAGIITLNPFRTRGDLLNLLVRELRRAWQARNGALVNPLKFEPDDAILLNRAQAADAFMFSVRVAWELKLAGAQEAWNHIAGSPMADIGRAFELKAQGDFRSLNNGEAARAAYDKFFEDTRVKAHDKRLIHQMLLDENGYMRKTGGGNRGEKIGIDLFARLGEMPQGRNYLSVRGGRAPLDASYAAVEDRSNANFLWFIKFERSFHEKELQMMQESVKLSAEIVDFAKWALRHQQGAGA